MRLATACLLLLSTSNNNNTPLVGGFQFNPLNYISTRNTNTQNVGTPQIISTTPTTITSSQPNTITITSSAVALAATKQEDGESSGFGNNKKGRPKPPPRRSPTKDIKQAMAANDLVRVYLYCCMLFFCVLCV